MNPKEYFSHDYGTRHKMRLAALIKEKKMRGYGLFWVIVEMLYEASDKWLNLDEVTYIAIEGQSGESSSYVREFVAQGIDRYKVFKQEENRFTTERVLVNMDTRLALSEARSESGKKGAMARWQNMASAISKDGEAIANDGNTMAKNGKEKESKEKKSKGYLRPKGLTAALAADSAEIKALKEKYDLLVFSLDGKPNLECWTTIKTFIEEHQPRFIEPFIDAWNIFALTHGLIKRPISITRYRRDKWETRIKEPGFDFLAILAMVKRSRFLRGDNDRKWKVSFEYIIDSEEKYTKILEEKYD